MKHSFYKRLGTLLIAAALCGGCASETTLNKEAAADEATASETADKGTTSTDATDQKDTTGTTSDSSSATTDTTTTEETKDDDIDIDGTIVSSTSINLNDYSDPVKITNAGTYTLTGSGQMVIVDASKQNVTLILDGVTLKSDNTPALFVKKAASVTIELKGDNTMTTGSNQTYEPLDAALYSKADLVMKGSGSLTITSGYEHGIKAKDTAVFEGGTYNITAPNDGIHVNETADFKDGTYTINVQGEGMEAKDAMVIDGGTYTINAKDDGINAINSLTINGGTVQVVSSTNDGIDSNGDLIINGGEVTSIASKTPEIAFDTDNTPLEFNGGKILGIGSMGSSVTSAKQPVLMVGVSTVITSAELKTTDGTSVVKWDVPSYSGQTGALILSDSSMQQGTTYDLYINGSSYAQITLSSQITTYGNVQSMGGGGGRGQFGGTAPSGEMPSDFGGKGQRPGRFGTTDPNTDASSSATQGN